MFVQSYIKFQLYAAGVVVGCAAIFTVLFPDAENEHQEQKENYGFELFALRKTLKEKFGIDPLSIDIDEKEGKSKTPSYDEEEAANYDVERRRRVEELYNIKENSEKESENNSKS